MINALIASVALVAGSAVAQDWGSSGGSAGSAVVINQCSYDVYLSNTPSDDGVHSIEDRTLSPGGSYSQPYTELANGNGWSLKLSKDPNAYSSDILQYEYTYHPGEPIWYDLSEVNGNPWDGNWEITATGDCSPRQAAYRYATDDAYGMQSCDASSTITVTVCSGDSGSSSPPGSQPPASQPPATPSSPWQSAPPAAPTSAAPLPSNTWGAPPSGFVADKNVEAAAGDAAADKLADDTWDGPAVTVTNLVYQTVTEIVTATGHAKRHVHHPRHPHHRR